MVVAGSGDPGRVDSPVSVVLARGVLIAAWPPPRAFVLSSRDFAQQSGCMLYRARRGKFVLSLCRRRVGLRSV